jgi:hypothetical protein
LIALFEHWRSGIRRKCPGANQRRPSLVDEKVALHDNGLAPGVFKPAYRQIGVTLFPCMAIFALPRYLAL